MPLWKKQVGNYTEHTTSKLNKKEWQYLINYPKHLDITHTGKCIRRFGGIYAYCRYFIDRKWKIMVLIL